MEHMIACKITDWCKRRYDMSESQVVTVTYGIELLLNNVLKMVALFIIAVIFGRVPEYFIAIGCFASLRSYAGGLHMQTSLGCFLTMLTIFVLSCLGAEYVTYLPLWALIGAAAVSIVILSIYAPFYTKNNPIRDPQIIKKKKAGSIILAAVFFMAAALIPVMSVKMLILVPITIESLSILPIWHVLEKKK